MIMLYDNVLIKPLKGKVDMVIPDSQARIPNRGEVVAVGPGDFYGYPNFVPTGVKVGHKVCFSKDRAMEIELKGEKHYIVKERDVFGSLQNDEVD